MPPGHHVGHDHGLFERALPLLDADVGAGEGVPPATDVSGGEDVGLRRPALLVADDAVVDLDRRAGQPLGVRHGADTDQQQVRGEELAVVEADALDTGVALHLGHRRRAAHDDAAGLVQIGDDAAGVLARARG